MKIGIGWSRDRAAAVLALAVTGASLSDGAAAQALDPAELHPLDDDRTDLEYEGLTIDQLEDMDVVRDGEVIGEINAVLGNEDGDIAAIVLEYGGGVLGAGDEEVVIAIDQLDFPRGKEQAETTLSNAELAELPRWDSD